MSDNLLYYGDNLDVPALWPVSDRATWWTEGLHAGGETFGWQVGGVGRPAPSDVVEAGGRVAGAMIAFRTLLGENPAAPGLAYLANMAPRRSWNGRNY